MPERTAAWRMYLLLALFDTRDESLLADLVRSAREAYEREEFEDDAWQEFDLLWARTSEGERLVEALERWGQRRIRDGSER